EWTDTNDQPLAGQTWVSASIYPAAVFNQQLVSAESHVTTVLGAPSGIGKLHIKLVDLAGNVSADITNSAWLVSYNPNPPLVTGITVAGLVQSGGSNYVQSSSSLQVGYTPSTAVGNKDVQWGVASGTTPTVWGGWGNGFGSVSSSISVDGASYQIQFMARNPNGQATGVLSSEVFIKDSIAPTNVTASLLGGSNSFVAGQPIQVVVNATASFSGVSWSWSYQNTDVMNAAAVSASYQPGAAVVILQQGNYNLVFTATSGSGIAVSNTPIRVTITGTGLVVRDFQKYTDGRGVIGGAWSYVGGTPAPASY